MSSYPANTEALPRPVTIGSITGWLHGTGARGVLMCGAAGFEGAAAYQSWRILADLIARAGYTVLRFDYPGESDSADVDLMIDAAQLAVADAAQFLRTLTGPAIDIVCLRLGVLLAMSGLLDKAAPARTVMIAPVFSGRSYVRELKASARLFASTPGRETTLSTDGVALCGHHLTASDCDRLSALGISSPPSGEVLAVLPNGLASPDLGGDTDTLPFPGYASMMSPAEVVPPLDTFGQIVDWLGPAKGRRLLPPPEATAITGPGFTETRLAFGSDSHLAGTWCAPVGDWRGACYVLPNAGSNPRFGWARMSVDHARALARQGIASLRFDLSGMGDSDWRPESPRKAVYDPCHLADMRAAIALAKARGAREIHLAGLCSGGYLSLHTAAADDAVRGVVAVNVLKMIWTHGVDDLDAIEKAATQASRLYEQKALSSSSWLRVLKGEIPLVRLMAIAGLFGGKLLRRLFALVGYEGKLPEETRRVRTMMRSLAARGVSVTFVHSDLDSSRDEAERHFGAGERFVRSLPGVSVEIIPDADHELTPKKARDRLEVILADRARNA